MAKGNTAKRILVSLIAIPVLIAACLVGKYFFLAFVMTIGLASFIEFKRMAVNKNAFVNAEIGLLSVSALILNSYFQWTDLKIIIYSSVILLSLHELFRNKQSAIFNIGTTLLGVFYIGAFSASLIEIREFFSREALNYSYGGELIIAVMVTIWVCDSAAFFIGSKFGKHKMFPRVSPKKSWEGALAGFTFAVIAMLLIRHFAFSFISYSEALIIGVLIGLVGQLGDLIESLFKRDAKVKDSSNIIPGHGGVFDRFDSLLYTAPVIFIYLNFIR